MATMLSRFGLRMGLSSFGIRPMRLCNLIVKDSNRKRWGFASNSRYWTMMFRFGPMSCWVALVTNTSCLFHCFGPTNSLNCFGSRKAMKRTRTMIDCCCYQMSYRHFDAVRLLAPSVQR